MASLLARISTRRAVLTSFAASCTAFAWEGRSNSCLSCHPCEHRTAVQQRWVPRQCLPGRYYSRVTSSPAPTAPAVDPEVTPTIAGLKQDVGVEAAEGRASVDGLVVTGGVGASGSTANVTTPGDDQEPADLGDDTRTRIRASLHALQVAHARTAVDEQRVFQQARVWKGQVYIPVDVEGWQVFLNSRLLTDEKLGAQFGLEVLRAMRGQLIFITRVVRPKQLKQLRSIPIWVEVDNSGDIECCCYHVSEEWLTEHNYNPAKVRGVEVTHARRFLAYSIDQPHMLLHELAHGFHGRVLGWDNEEVLQCYEEAVASEKYDQVLRNSAHVVRHYGLTDEREYFAKLTETWLATSDFFPFVHAELRDHDPRGWHLMNSVWGPPPTHWRYRAPWEPVYEEDQPHEEATPTDATHTASTTERGEDAAASEH